MKKTERKPMRAMNKETDAPKAEATKRRNTADPGNNLSLAEIKQLIELISEKQFNEFELERGSFRLRLSKGAATVPTKSIADEAAIAPPPIAPAPPALSAALPAAAVAPVSAPPEEKLHILNSPIVGTFYGSPLPTSPSFVNVGDRVEEGRVLCIIEAMKLMNEIQSDISGVIAKIFVEDGQPVEFGQPLYGIKK